MDHRILQRLPAPRLQTTFIILLIVSPFLFFSTSSLLKPYYQLFQILIFLHPCLLLFIFMHFWVNQGFFYLSFSCIYALFGSRFCKYFMYLLLFCLVYEVPYGVWIKNLKFTRTSFTHRRP